MFIERNLKKKSEPVVFYNTDKNIYNARILKFSSFQSSICSHNILYNKGRNKYKHSVFQFCNTDWRVVASTADG